MAQHGLDPPPEDRKENGTMTRKWMLAFVALLLGTLFSRPAPAQDCYASCAEMAALEYVTDNGVYAACQGFAAINYEIATNNCRDCINNPNCPSPPFDFNLCMDYAWQYYNADLWACDAQLLMLYQWTEERFEICISDC
jgi:hypothetical protein